LALLPVVRVADEVELGALAPALEHERARPERVAAEALAVLVELLLRVDAERERRERGEEGGERLGHREPDLRRADRRDSLQRRDRERPRALRVALAVDRGGDGGRGQRRPARELDAAPEREDGDAPALAELPARRQLGLDALSELDEPVVDLQIGEDRAV